MQEQGLGPGHPSLHSHQAKRPDCPVPTPSILLTISKLYRCTGEREAPSSSGHACAWGRGDHLHREPSSPAPHGRWRHGGAQGMMGLTGKPPGAHAEPTGLSPAGVP